MKFIHRTDIDKTIHDLAAQGYFLKILDQNLKEMGYSMSQKDRRHFQGEFLRVAASFKRPFSEKINVIERLINDALESVEKIIELTGQLNHQNHQIVESKHVGAPQCLTSIKDFQRKVTQGDFTHTEKKPLREIKFFKDRTGKPLGFLLRNGNRVEMHGIGSRGLLGYYLKSVGDSGATFRKGGHLIGYGNLLGMLLGPTEGINSSSK